MVLRTGIRKGEEKEAALSSLLSRLAGREPGASTSLSSWENPVLGQRESSTCAGRHSPAHTLSSSVMASPLTVMGGSKSPFAYTSLRWDSDTHSPQILICHSRLSKGQPLPFLDGEAE